MKWRILEGKGEAIYRIGTNDDGSPYNLTKEQLISTLKNLNAMASKYFFSKPKFTII